MDKKHILILLIVFIISFSAGIFTEIIMPGESLKLSTALPSLASGIADYLKSDFLTVSAALIFSAGVFSMPLVPLIVVGKLFSLGFSAAYILSSSSENAFAIVMAVLVPRGVFKIPAYIALVVISLETAAFVRQNYQNPKVLKRDAPSHLLRFFFCFLALAASSVPEAFLLQGVL